MKQLTHRFFGKLDLENGLGDYNLDETIVLWEEEANGIKSNLWYVKGSDISSAILDTFSRFLNHFNEYHQKSLKALEDYLKEDDEYIVFHKNELELDVPENTSKFVRSMSVANIGLWADGENVIIVDYMIAPEESDQILAVKFDKNLEVADVAWES